MMAKNVLLALVLVAAVAGGAFAQTGFGALPKNTITVDTGPLIFGTLILAEGEIADGDGSISTSGFGIAAQYERHLLERVSVAGRFAYLGYGAVFSEGGISLTAKLSSFSLECHARYYPLGSTFFLDGMLGYANLAINFSGKATATDRYGNKETVSISLPASRSYCKAGAKLGWRIDFGKPGGFVFEPSLGYYGGIGIGDTLVKRLARAVDREIDGIDGLDEPFKIFENIMFIGGPRLSLSFGWKF